MLSVLVLLLFLFFFFFFFFFVFFFFFNDTATTEIYTILFVGSVRCVKRQVLDRVAFSRNGTHLSCEEVYDLNLYGCNFSNEPVYGAAANTALELGTIRSFSMFGGSIEGYKNGISLTSGGCHLFGVYFETQTADAYGIALWDCTGANVVMTGCTIYLDYHAYFVRMSSGATDTSILSNGNVFCSGATAHGNPGNAFYLVGGVEAHLAQDNWYGVQDDTLYYVGGMLSNGPASGLVIEFPAGYTHASEYSTEASPIFMGKPLYMGNGKNIQLGQTTGTKIGLLYYEKLGFLGATPVTRQTVAGARDEPEGALASLITALAAFGLILDSTTAS